MTILDQIDRVTSGLCACGAPPADGSAYCSDDCRPTHIAEDTDQTGPGGMSRHGVATSMRWRPDLVTEADDSDLVNIGEDAISHRQHYEWLGYSGRHHAHLFERRSNPDVWHLRLDDGHRYVGCDLDGVGGRQDPITVELVRRAQEAWRRLERELGNPRHTEADVFVAVEAARIARRPLVAGQLVTEADLLPVAAARDTSLFTWTRRCRACQQRSQPIAGRRFSLIDPQWIDDTEGPVSSSFDDIEDCNVCPRCRTPFPGPPLCAVIQHPNDAESLHAGIAARLVLYATASGQRHKWGRVVTEHDLIATTDSPGEVIEQIWDEMEEALLRLIDSEPQAVASPLPSWLQPMGRDEVMARFREAYEQVRARSQNQQ